MSLDTKTFAAWVKTKRVLAAWSSYPAPASIPSNIRPRSENEQIDSFESFDCVERAIIAVCPSLNEHQGVRQLLKRAVKSGGLFLSGEDSLVGLRDAAIREVARRW